MNKTKFIEELMKQTNYDKEKCTKISDILEDNFFIGKKNKEKTINQIITTFNCDEEEANKIYETTSSIIATELKNKLKHPFKSQD